MNATDMVKYELATAQCYYNATIYMFISIHVSGLKYMYMGLFQGYAYPLVVFLLVMLILTCPIIDASEPNQ